MGLGRGTVLPRPILQERSATQTRSLCFFQLRFMGRPRRLNRALVRSKKSYFFFVAFFAAFFDAFLAAFFAGPFFFALCPPPLPVPFILLLKLR